MSDTSKTNFDAIIINWYRNNVISDADFILLQIELFKRCKNAWDADVSALDLEPEEFLSIRVFCNTHNQIVITARHGDPDSRHKPMCLKLYEQYAN
tara:strand:- start:2200 stop:2487 length:288 start_codon:yes stop_codon:yes gene_type:complete